jgi:hypothetical protein
MGVMLSLDRRPPDRGRRRQGQHERQPDDQPRARVLAPARRSGAPAGGGLLARLSRTMLARKGGQGAGRGGRARSGDVPAALYPGMSVACLLGECQDEAGYPACEGERCEHDCHRRTPASGAGTAPAA